MATTISYKLNVIFADGNGDTVETVSITNPTTPVDSDTVIAFGDAYTAATGNGLDKAVLYTTTGEDVDLGD